MQSGMTGATAASRAALSPRLAAVDRERCVSCGACANECPVSAIEIWRGCYARVDSGRCVGCGRCERICPAGSIALRDRDER